MGDGLPQKTCNGEELKILFVLNYELKYYGYVLLRGLKVSNLVIQSPSLQNDPPLSRNTNFDERCTELFF